MSDLKLRARLIRKPRGIGIIPGGPSKVATEPTGHGSVKMKSEALDEVVFRCQKSLRDETPRIALPWCAFNGGRDAWVDVGDKCVGVQAMQAYLKIPPSKSLHVGDQFLKTGNDVAARECSPCIWIIRPQETFKILEILLGFMGLRSSGSGGGGSARTPRSPGGTKMRTFGTYTYAVPELASPHLTAVTAPTLAPLPPTLSLGVGTTGQSAGTFDPYTGTTTPGP